MSSTVFVTSHDFDSKATEPTVTVKEQAVPLKTVLDGAADVACLHASSLNAPNQGEASDPKLYDGPLVIPDGSQLRITVLKPSQTAGMHRTSSIDYNIFLEGEADLITPDEMGTEEMEGYKVIRTRVKAQQTVVQRGTLHAWQNVGKVDCKWICVLVSAQPVEIGGKALADVDL